MIYFPGIASSTYSISPFWLSYGSFGKKFLAGTKSPWNFDDPGTIEFE